MNKNLIWSFVFLAITVQLPAQQSATNAAITKKTSTSVISVNAPDGSLIGANFDWETNFIDELVSMPTNAAAVTTNKFFIENEVLAEKGDAAAQVDLGWRYFKGFGVAKDYTEATKWFRKAADQGNVLAQRNLAACYANGLGVPQDKTEADKWYHSAVVQEFKETKALAEQGDANTQSELGRIYESGIGVPQDGAEAAKWFRRAAEQGNAFAQFNMGLLYMAGMGLPQDYVESYKWFNLAAAQGNASGQYESAVANRDELAQQMTPDQIAEAQQLAREFQPRKESSSGNSTSPENPTASGSGFFITDDGYLISNYHVVKDAIKIRLVTSAGTIDAKVVQVDAANDLALLKADGKFSPLPIVASRSAHLGSTVATIGFPDPSLQGFSPKLAKGEIASLSGAGDDPRYFQISVPVQPGNSGGALVDERGNVIGIVSAKLDASVALAASGALPENVNYAVKSSLLLSFLESVPDVDAKLKKPNTTDEKFEDVVKQAQAAAVLVLVY